MFFNLPVASFSKGFHFFPLLLQVLLMNFFQQRSSWLEYIDPLLLLGWANWLLGNAALQCFSLEVWALLLISSGFLRHGGDQIQGPTLTNTAKVFSTWNLLPQSSHWPELVSESSGLSWKAKLVAGAGRRAFILCGGRVFLLLSK